jgi:hypothetical protein
MVGVVSALLTPHYSLHSLAFSYDLGFCKILYRIDTCISAGACRKEMVK